MSLSPCLHFDLNYHIGDKHHQDKKRLAEDLNLGKSCMLQNSINVLVTYFPWPGVHAINLFQEILQIFLLVWTQHFETSFKNGFMSKPKTKIMAHHFHDRIFGVYQVPPWHQGWPYHPCILSGSFNVLQVHPWRTPHSWQMLSDNIDMKFSG